MIFEYSVEKERVASPLPAFEELTEVNGKLEKFTKYPHSVGTTVTDGGAGIRLTTGEQFFLSEAVYSILSKTDFRQSAYPGNSITLWVSYQKQDSLDGECPVIYQISLNGATYLDYKQVYEKIAALRLWRVKDIFVDFFLLSGILLVSFFSNLIYYKWTGKIPKRVLKYLKKTFSEFEDIDIEMGGKFIEPIACEEIKDTEEIRATVYGKVCSVEVEYGQQINSGDAVVILAALQMQIPVSASMDGVVEEIYVHEGDKVEKDALLILIRNV